MRDKRFLITAVCIYLAYFTHGMQAITISQLREQFMLQWNTDLAGVMGVIAWTGVAKLVSVWACGEISDRIGRRPLVIIGAVGYLVFFSGLLVSGSLLAASVCAFLAGASTSCFDGSCYPALQESFPKAPAAALVALKGFISLAGMFYPLLIGWLVSDGAAWRVALWAPLACSGLVLLLGSRAPFSYDEELKAGKQGTPAPAARVPAARFASPPRFAVEGSCCLLYGFISMMTLYLVQQCLTIYGRDVLMMTDMDSRALTTYFTAGSLTAVFIATAIMARGARPLGVLLVYTLGSFIALCLMYYARQPAVLSIASFSIGFCAAGGAMQAGLAVFGEFFPSKKGRNLGVYYTFMGLAASTGPMIVAWLLRRATLGLTPASEAYRLAEVAAKTQIVAFNAAVAGAGFILMLIIAVRYRKVFGVGPFARRRDTALP